MIPAGADDEFPRLADDFRLWRTELERPFRRLDHEAQLLQHAFWRQNLALILGGFVATVLGALQSASGGGHPALGVVQALLTALLAGLTALVHVRRPLRGYLTARLKAERIKSEFFLFLGRVEEYAGAEREARLRRRVVDITTADAVA